MSMTPLWPKRIMSFLVLLNENNHPPSNICQTANPKMPHLPVHGKVFWSHLSGNYQICLVGAYNPFEKCARQIGSSPNTGENKNISNHHPVSYWLFVILDTVLPFCWLHQRGNCRFTTGSITKILILILAYWNSHINWVVLLMADILHQLIWYSKFPIIYRVLYIPLGSGFLPSTVKL